MPGRALGASLLLQSLTQLEKGRAWWMLGLLTAELGFIFRDGGIDLVPVSPIEIQDLANQGQRERGKLLVQHLGSVPSWWSEITW